MVVGVRGVISPGSSIPTPPYTYPRDTSDRNEARIRTLRTPRYWYRGVLRLSSMGTVSPPIGPPPTGTHQYLPGCTSLWFPYSSDQMPILTVPIGWEWAWGPRGYRGILTHTGVYTGIGGNALDTPLDTPTIPCIPTCTPRPL